MQIQTKIISLANGSALTVCEADGSFDYRLARQEADAKKLKLGDKTLIYFATYFYPILYACTRGEFPALEAAYVLPAADLDAWYMAVAELNPEIIKSKFMPAEERVCIFRDDTQVIVHRTNDLPSYMLKLFRLEQEAEENIPENADEVSFRLMIYPKLAACSTGDVPVVDNAIQFPRSELSKWMEAAVELNQEWFMSIINAAAEINKKDLVKKKRGSRRARKKDGAVLPGEQ